MAPESLPLRDIHLPEPITWWPPAFGWWLLLILFCLLILVILLMWRRMAKKRKEAKTVARRELRKLQIEYQHHHNSQKLVQEISILMRRVCLSYYPRTEVASLTGEAWLQFLDQQVGNQQFTQGSGQCLIKAPYVPRVDIDIESLIKLCHSVIDSKLMVNG